MTALQIISIVGTLETIILIGAIVYGVILWVRGIFPALYRLGNGLAKRKIALFAKGDNLASLRSLLLDSKLFNRENIIEIATKNDLGRLENTTVYLIFWSDWKDSLDDILRQKRDQCAMIIYAPYNESRISNEDMAKLDGKRNTAVTNFRGRLLNDILTSMITTGCKREYER